MPTPAPAPPDHATVATLSPEQFRDLLERRGPAGFLPAPGPARGGGTEPVGWFTDGVPGAVTDGPGAGGPGAGHPVAGALLYIHAVPRPRRSTVTLLEGPDLDWSGLAAAGTLGRWLAPLVSRLRGGGAVRAAMSPPVTARTWSANTVSAALAAAAVRPGDGPHPGDTGEPVRPADAGTARAAGGGFPLEMSDPDAFPAVESTAVPVSLADVRPDDPGRSGAAIAAQLASLDWLPPTGPRPYRVRIPLAGRSAAQLWAAAAPRRRGTVQLAEGEWVRVDVGQAADPALGSVRAAAVLPGGPVRPGTPAQRWAELAGFGPRRRLLLARQGDRVLAACLSVRTGAADSVVERVVARWSAPADGAGERSGEDSVGAPGVDAAGAVLSWQLVRAAHTDGVRALDLGPVDPGLDPHAGPTAGLHEAVATGADVGEQLGQWTLVLDRRAELIRRAAHRFRPRR